jgi:hypothetical protein
MYSRLIRFIVALSGLFPILLIFWLENVINDWKSLHVYIEINKFWQGLLLCLNQHWPLLSFAVLLWLCRTILRGAWSKLPSQTFSVKSIKPADPNFLSILLSYLAPWFKMFISSDHDRIYIAGFLLIALCLAYITSESYQYNISFRLFFGYRNFEVQSTGDITYLVLSKKNLINKSQLQQVAKLSDYMLINTSS